MVSPPFADAEEGDDTDVIGEEEDLGDANVTDTEGDSEGYDDEQTTVEELHKSIAKSMNDGVVPKHQYIKLLSNDQYDKMIGKDMYAFLHGHRDEIINVLAVGKDVSQYFKTLDAEDVKEVYRIILTAIEKVGWSSAQMSQDLQDAFPELLPYEADRIIRTEVTRILYYAKEQYALREERDEYLYSWMGPTDSRTTPMCYYMQEGKLRPSDIKALEKAGHSPSELPEIPKEGMPLWELKETCRKVAELFGYDMISDWVMHINCRHTFVRGQRNAEPELATREELDRLIDEISAEDYQWEEMGRPAYLTAEPLQVELKAEDDDMLIFDVNDDFDNFLVFNSIYDMPTFYSSGEHPIRIFENMDEHDIASWARVIVELQVEGIDDVTIVWALQDQGFSESDDTLGYLIAHSDEVLERAINEGWFD